MNSRELVMDRDQQIPVSLFPLPSQPLPAAQHSTGSPLKTLGRFATIAEKHARQEQDTPPPNLPFYPALGNSLPPLSPFKSKNQAPGLLGAGRLGLGTPSWAAEGRHGSERSRGRRPGGYLGTEGGEAGELGGAGSHTSHRRSAGGSGRSDSRVLREDLPQSLNVNDKKRGCSGRR